MGELKYLILHCSDTPPNREVTEEDIRQWHIVERGWSKYGYSKLFQRSGNVLDFYDIDNDQWVEANEITNGAVGFNRNSVHWCFAGGKIGANGLVEPDKILTSNQMIAFKVEINEFLKYHPQVVVIGHNQVSTKLCPGFKVSELLRLSGIPNKYIKEGKIT